MELDFEGLETRQWNRPTDRAQIVCLVIMFTPGVMVIKMSKCQNHGKSQPQFGQNISAQLKNLI